MLNLFEMFDVKFEPNSLQFTSTWTIRDCFTFLVFQISDSYFIRMDTSIQKIIVDMWFTSIHRYPESLATCEQSSVDLAMPITLQLTM